jgi:hypothetical protein
LEKIKKNNGNKKLKKLTELRVINKKNAEISFDTKKDDKINVKPKTFE